MCQCAIEPKVERLVHEFPQHRVAYFYVHSPSVEIGESWLACEVHVREHRHRKFELKSTPPVINTAGHVDALVQAVTMARGYIDQEMKRLGA